MYKNKSDSDNLYKDFTIALAEIPTLYHILLGFLNLKRGYLFEMHTRQVGYTKRDSTLEEH
jgi:hypothetical protein